MKNGLPSVRSSTSSSTWAGVSAQESRLHISSRAARSGSGPSVISVYRCGNALRSLLLELPRRRVGLRREDVGEHDRRLVRQVHQLDQQLDRAGVGPLEGVEHQDQRTIGQQHAPAGGGRRRGRATGAVGRSGWPAALGVGLDTHHQTERRGELAQPEPLQPLPERLDQSGIRAIRSQIEQSRQDLADQAVAQPLGVRRRRRLDPAQAQLLRRARGPRPAGDSSRRRARRRSPTAARVRARAPEAGGGAPAARAGGRRAGAFPRRGRDQGPERPAPGCREPRRPAPAGPCP